MGPPAHDRRLGDEYRLERLADSDSVTAEDVVALWSEAGALSSEEAERRVAEVAFVAVHETDGLAGLSTTYLAHNAQLRMDLWYYRTYVAAGHRRSSLAFLLIHRTVDDLESRWSGGEDRRAAGVMFELQNELLKKSRNAAVWRTTGFAFIGENARGDHCRVRYFPGALAPIPAVGYDA
jgi:hypothetical protein